MNMFANLEKEDARILEQADPQYHPFLRRTITRLKQAGLPGRRRSVFLSELLEQCRTHALTEADAERRCTEFIREERARLSIGKRLILQFSDLPMVLFLYAGLYEIALDQLLDPLIHQEPVHWMFPLTFSLLVNTLIVYFIMRVLIRLLARASSTVSLYYWIVLLVGFLAFLGLTYLSRTYLTISLCACPTLVFIAVTALLAWGALTLYRNCDR